MNNQQTNHSNNPLADGSNTSASIDIGTVLNGIMARKSWVILATLVAAAGSVAFVAMAKPVYQAEARVLVENLETDFSRTDPQRSPSSPIGQQEVKSQVEVLQSRDLAKKVIKGLKLTERSEFDPLKGGIGPISKFLISLGFKPDPSKQSPEQRALGAYYKKLTTYQISESKVIVINVKSGDPEMAAAVANTLGEVFVANTRNVQSKSTGRAREWLADQINSLRKKVVNSEVAAEKYRAEAGLLNGRDSNITLSSQELSELNSQIILAEAQRAEIQARAKSIRNLLSKTGSVASSSEVLNSPLIQRLRERQITLRGNLAELSTTYLPNHPRVASVKREITGLNRQIRSEALKIVSGLEQQAKVSTARVGSLRASLNNLKTQASGTNIDRVKLRALEREAKANRTLLETFLNKFSDASARENSSAQPGLARLISKADVPSQPSFPKPGPTIILATIGGMVMSLGLAFMAAVMSAVSSGAGSVRTGSNSTGSAQSQFRSAEQSTASEFQLQQKSPSVLHAQSYPSQGVSSGVVPKDLQAGLLASLKPALAPVAVTAPSLSLLPASLNLQIAQANALAGLNNNGSEFSTGLAPVTSWANSIRQTLGVKRLAVLGLPGAELDTAVMCLGLARSLAAQGIKTIIVDAAMQNSPPAISQLAAMTRTANLPGLAELLTGHASFLDVIIKDDHTTARILRVGQSLPDAWPLLSDDRMETVLSALGDDNNHDFIIVHGGTLSASGSIDNGAVAKCQSSLMVVVEEQADMAGHVMQQLEIAGMQSSQYVRIANGGNLHLAPVNTRSIHTA